MKKTNLLAFICLLFPMLASAQSQAMDVVRAEPDKPSFSPLEKMTFLYARKGWEIILTAQSLKKDEAAARNLAFDYFRVEDVPEQQELISRVYRGEFKTPNEFAVFLYKSSLASLPRHPNHHEHSDAEMKRCFQRLNFPQFAYFNKHGRKASEDAVVEKLEGTNAEYMRTVVHDMYAARDQIEEADVYWRVYDACVHNP